jgi:ABC-2 type transport system permease protein
MRNYYLKPPNLSWGIIFPLAWTGMFLIRSGGTLDSIAGILPGVITISILFGTTSMLAVTITFEKKNRTFDRLLQSPLPLWLLLFSKTAGAIIFGVINALVPLFLGIYFAGISEIIWWQLFSGIILLSFSSSFMGLLVAVSVSEVFEAQTLSNFFRFPMIFLCGLFFPVSSIPLIIRPLSYLLPVTYGADILHSAVSGNNFLPFYTDIIVLSAFTILLFFLSTSLAKKRWIG